MASLLSVGCQKELGDPEQMLEAKFEYAKQNSPTIRSLRTQLEYLLDLFQEQAPPSNELADCYSQREFDFRFAAAAGARSANASLQGQRLTQIKELRNS